MRELTNQTEAAAPRGGTQRPRELLGAETSGDKGGSDGIQGRL